MKLLSYFLYLLERLLGRTDSKEVPYVFLSVLIFYMKCIINIIDDLKRIVLTIFGNTEHGLKSFSFIWTVL